MTTKVAIPIWNGRVSPVMDTACRLLVVDFADSREVSRDTWDIPQVTIPYRVSFLADRGVKVLICGAISHQFERMLAASGIEPIPWFGGDVDRIIAAYVGGALHNDNYRLPGCGRGRGQGRGRCRDRGTGFGRRKQLKEE